MIDFEIAADEFGEVFDGEGSVRQDRLVVLREVEPIAERSLDRATKPIERESTDKIGRQLTRRLLGPDDLTDRLSFGLKRAHHQQFHRLGIGHIFCVHFLIEDRVDDGAQVKLKLLKAQARVACAEALIEHHLFGVDGPSFGEGSRRENFTNERRVSIAVFELNVMSGISLVDRQDFEHCGVVFFEEAGNTFGAPICGRGADREFASSFGIEGGGGIEISDGIAPHEFGHFDYAALIGIGEG